ncbi:LacI family DNA-binding transcriptional regulator [Petropleomorpha daqingensis]|uniref:DNA-binding LacI/PurR family transcriptional regulator n=1 Tax=Petropleomorpha daqingensis TaxID=2026353 RepID=A0A853CCQ3_9ACTN|nr:DNA-binding LacI/PurR family transcriptional regulator [Petropleomorpha daqingensis]
MPADAHPAVTLEHVARAAGVSRATASRALTGGGPVSTETQRQVRAAARALGYVADPVARALVSGRGARVVVAVVSDCTDVSCWYLARVVTAGAQVLTPEGLGIGVVPVPRQRPAGVLDALARDRTIGGLVLLNTTREVLAELPRGLVGRTVSIGVGSATVPAVDVDGAAAARRRVEHLVRSGRRRIAMITGPSWLPCTHRPVAAYRAAVQAAGLPVRVVPGGFCAADGAAGAATLLARWPDIDAIVASCDEVAFGALSTLRRSGRRVPGDVAVAGFDDVPAAELTDLTTTTHPVADIATAAVRTVLDGVRDEQRFFPSELVVRASA